MSSGKPRRRVTVDNTGEDDYKSRTSVFARLGSGGPAEQYEHKRARRDPCRHWVSFGKCNFYPDCKFSHPNRTEEPYCIEDVHGKAPRKISRDHSDSETERFDPRVSQKLSDSKLKSAIVHKSQHSDQSDSEPDGAGGVLDFDSELKLVKKQQYLQKQLSLLEQEEGKTLTTKENITIERQVGMGGGDSDMEMGMVAAGGHHKKRKKSSKESRMMMLGGDQELLSPPKKKKKEKKKKKNKARSPSMDGMERVKEKKHKKKSLDRLPKRFSPSMSPPSSRSSISPDAPGGRKQSPPIFRDPSPPPHQQPLQRHRSRSKKSHQQMSPPPAVVRQRSESPVLKVKKHKKSVHGSPDRLGDSPVKGKSSKKKDQDRRSSKRGSESPPAAVSAARGKKSRSPDSHYKKETSRGRQQHRSAKRRSSSASSAPSDRSVSPAPVRARQSPESSPERFLGSRRKQPSPSPEKFLGKKSRNSPSPDGKPRRKFTEKSLSSRHRSKSQESSRKRKRSASPDDRSKSKRRTSREKSRQVSPKMKSTRDLTMKRSTTKHWSLEDDKREEMLQKSRERERDVSPAAAGDRGGRSTSRRGGEERASRRPPPSPPRTKDGLDPKDSKYDRHGNLKQEYKRELEKLEREKERERLRLEQEAKEQEEREARERAREETRAREEARREEGRSRVRGGSRDREEGRGFDQYREDRSKPDERFAGDRSRRQQWEDGKERHDDRRKDERSASQRRVGGEVSPAPSAHSTSSRTATGKARATDKRYDDRGDSKRPSSQTRDMDRDRGDRERSKRPRDDDVPRGMLSGEDDADMRRQPDPVDDRPPRGPHDDRGEYDDRRGDRRRSPSRGAMDSRGRYPDYPDRGPPPPPLRDSGVLRDTRDIRDPRDPRFDPRDIRDPRDLRDLRDLPRGFDGRDLRGDLRLEPPPRGLDLPPHDLLDPLPRGLEPGRFRDDLAGLLPLPPGHHRDDRGFFDDRGRPGREFDPVDRDRLHPRDLGHHPRGRSGDRFDPRFDHPLGPLPGGPLHPSDLRDPLIPTPPGGFRDGPPRGRFDPPGDRGRFPDDVLRGPEGLPRGRGGIGGPPDRFDEPQRRGGDRPHWRDDRRGGPPPRDWDNRGRDDRPPRDDRMPRDGPPWDGPGGPRDQGPRDESREGRPGLLDPPPRDGPPPHRDGPPPRDGPPAPPRSESRDRFSRDNSSRDRSSRDRGEPKVEPGRPETSASVPPSSDYRPVIKKEYNPPKDQTPPPKDTRAEGAIKVEIKKEEDIKKEPEEVKKERKDSTKAEDGKDVDYEAISDDDLDDLIENVADEDKDKEDKLNPVDALDIDWAALVQNSQPKAAPKATSAMRRFTPAALFSRLGISHAFAGEALVDKVRAKCQEQLDAEAAEAAEGEQGTTDANTPQKAAAVAERKKFELYSGVGLLHWNLMNKHKQRADLLRDIGPNRRALCARRDLTIRRKLCGLEKEQEGVNLLMYPAQIVDQDFYKQNVQLFKRFTNTDSMRKLSSSSITS